MESKKVKTVSSKVKMESRINGALEYAIANTVKLKIEKASAWPAPLLFGLDEDDNEVFMYDWTIERLRISYGLTEESYKRLEEAGIYVRKHSYHYLLGTPATVDLLEEQNKTALNVSKVFKVPFMTRATKRWLEDQVSTGLEEMAHEAFSKTIMLGIIAGIMSEDSEDSSEDTSD